MSAREGSPRKTSFDVAPAHDAEAVHSAAPRETPVPRVSEAAVREIQQNAVTLRAPAVRGEEFDFDLTRGNIEPESALIKRQPKHGWAWLLLGLALLFCVYTFGAVNGEKSRRPLPVGPFSAPSGKPVTVKVQVAGAVNKPGVYELPFDARVQDAIRKAGGFKTLADTGAVNLADWAQDGAKIEIPTRATPAPAPTATIIIKEVTVAVTSGEPANAASPSSSGAAPKSESGIPLAKTDSGATSSNASIDYLKANPIDLNKATQAQLEVLPGVGPKMGERIIAYRTENGGFKSVDELDEVKGIGEKRMETLKPLVKVR